MSPGHNLTLKKAQRNIKIYFWRKIQFVLGLLARDIANHSYAPNTPLSQAFKPLENWAVDKTPKQTWTEISEGTFRLVCW